MPDDRTKLLKDLADVALQVWALTHSLVREPAPNWAGVARVIGDQREALKKAEEDALSRVSSG